MGMFRQRKAGSLVPAAGGICLLASLFLVSGCIGGTTYGTGVSQEKQTLTDVYNMFTLKSDKKNIDYGSRPDLVIPDDKSALPEPLDSEASTSNPEWPESPDQRIARIRAEVEAPDARTGNYSVQERLRKKEGIAIETDNPTRKFVPGVTDRDGYLLPHINADKKRRAEVLKRKAELELPQGATRRYLTDPPEEYRQPADTAPQGEEAYSEEELEERKKLAEEAEAREMKELVERGR
jgi:hypothetical protein